ncbi:hypothetical protein QBC32DRAFT_312660 [Pseudoneurospora amorphoporcata]|uniref:Uncharacterized protein n=1 Tax=Pseudoneurospora amorphoporcata TaxID=241081 RepID=A0AAN6NX67_9PEZI|nr:hypothetical protein QBC32DRAFT_312660 [Pseudoneurospora amorphoporcata]
MPETIELPGVLDTTLATKLLPIVNLQENLSNFDEWRHSVRFFLRYHKLLTFIGEHAGYPAIGHMHRGNLVEKDTNDDIFHRRLFVYSLIWKSAEAVIYSSLYFTWELRDKVHKNSQHDPRLLWNILCALRS